MFSEIIPNLGLTPASSEREGLNHTFSWISQIVEFYFGNSIKKFHTYKMLFFCSIENIYSLN